MTIANLCAKAGMEKMETVVETEVVLSTVI